MGNGVPERGVDLYSLEVQVKKYSLSSGCWSASYGESVRWGDNKGDGDGDGGLEGGSKEDGLKLESSLSSSCFSSSSVTFSLTCFSLFDFASLLHLLHMPMTVH